MYTSPAFQNFNEMNVRCSLSFAIVLNRSQSFAIVRDRSRSFLRDYFYLENFSKQEF